MSVFPPNNFLLSLPSTTFLDLRKNQIEYIHQLELSKYQKALGHPVINLYSNPIKCSCEMLWLRQTPKMSFHYVFEVCIDVITRQEQPFSLVPIEHFLCEVNDTDVCDVRCECLAPSASGVMKVEVVWCTGQGLHNIPNPLPASARSVQLADNSIVHMDFTKMSTPRLTKILVLSNNLISFIRQSCFRHFLLLEEVYLQNNHLTELNLNYFTQLVQLRILNISQNQLSNITQSLVTANNLGKLSMLILSNNDLEHINSDVRLYLSTTLSLASIYLSENPWVCDVRLCEGISWLDWMATNRRYVKDFRHTTCQLGNLTNVSVEHMVEMPLENLVLYDTCIGANSQHFESLSSMLYIATCFVLEITVIFAVYRNQGTIRVLLGMLRRLLMPSASGSTSRNLPYDAFVAYNDQNRVMQAWTASTLQPKLEETTYHPPYRLFLMCRDSALGIDMAAAIYDAIHLSKATILLVGDDYCQSRWSSYMLRIARQCTLDNPHHELIIILMDYNVRDVCTEDRLLKTYIDGGQYLVVTQHLFWQRLLNKLAETCRSNSSWSCHVSSSSSNFNLANTGQSATVNQTPTNIHDSLC